MKLKELLLENMLTDLLQMCKQELEIDELPDINLVDDKSVIAGSSFGLFDGNINVVTKDRHPMDVMRTIAHELVHWKQRTENQAMDGDDGSETENQANAIAGIIMRRFGKSHPECFTL